MKKSIFTAALFVGLAALGSAYAVEEVWSDPALDDPLLSIRQDIDAGKFDAAIAALEPLADSPNAEAEVFNLLGFSLRKSGNYADAEVAYKEALTIDPNHLGANEYLGELYLETDRMDLAMGQLTFLETACGASCAEYLALKTAVDAAHAAPATH